MQPLIDRERVAALVRSTLAELGAPRAISSQEPLLLCYGDGVWAAALNAPLEAFQAALLRELASRGVRVGTPIFLRHSRVKVMDEVARLLDAEACLFVCGERPGLGFADSMSAYYIYRPASGATDADREVISNINPRGLEPGKAAHAIADACARGHGAQRWGRPPRAP